MSLFKIASRKEIEKAEFTSALDAHLEQLRLKNIEYRDGCKNILRLINIQAVIILGLAFALIYYIQPDPGKDRYFAETIEGARMQVVGLSSPNLSKETILNWGQQAATDVMTFGFNDYPQRFAQNRNYFTAKGWESFMEAVTRSKLMKPLVAAQQIITAAPAGTAELTQEGIIEGEYGWLIEMPMLFTVRSGGIKKSFTKKVRILINKIPTEKNPNGIGIGLWFLYQ
jgi:intracellular multiplication protein IcmL